MKIHQFLSECPYGNYAYIVEKDGLALIIDPLNAAQILKKLAQHKLQMAAILITHEHDDHHHGLSDLLQHREVEVWAHFSLEDRLEKLDHPLSGGENLSITPFSDVATIRVLGLPGHSAGHIGFLLEKDESQHFFCGDTLFHAGVGNCKNGGDPAILFETIQSLIKNMHKDTIIYPGHNYIKKNLAFALQYWPDCPSLQATYSEILKKNSLAQLKRTFKQELASNIFLKELPLEVLRNINCEHATKKDVFLKLRQLRDNW